MMQYIYLFIGIGTLVVNVILIILLIKINTQEKSPEKISHIDPVEDYQDFINHSFEHTAEGENETQNM